MSTSRSFLSLWNAQSKLVSSVKGKFSTELMALLESKAVTNQVELNRPLASDYATFTSQIRQQNEAKHQSVLTDEAKAISNQWSGLDRRIRRLKQELQQEVNRDRRRACGRRLEVAKHSGIIFGLLLVSFAGSYAMYKIGEIDPNSENYKKALKYSDDLNKYNSPNNISATSCESQYSIFNPVKIGPAATGMIITPCVSKADLPSDLAAFCVDLLNVLCDEEPRYSGADFLKGIVALMLFALVIGSLYATLNVIPATKEVYNESLPINLRRRAITSELESLLKEREKVSVMLNIYNRHQLDLELSNPISSFLEEKAQDNPNRDHYLRIL